MSTPPDLDRMAVMRQFDRRARRIDGADFLLREVERRMFERLDLVRLRPAGMLDVGCGLGDGIRRLRTRYPEARAIGVDLSPALVARAQAIDTPSLGDRARGIARRLVGSLGAAQQAPAPGEALAGYLAADAHRLPLAAASVDLVWSNLAYHWFDDPLAAIAEWYRVVRPGGLLMFSAFGVDTLRELRESGYPTMALPDMHDIGDALAGAGFAEPVMDTERLTVSWTDPQRLRTELHLLGGNALRGRRRGLLTPRALDASLRRLQAAAPILDVGVGVGDRAPAPIPVSFELIYGHAWCPSAKKRSDGYAPIEFRPAGRRREAGR
jgi:malonyl-CoA O-methyltransferase